MCLVHALTTTEVRRIFPLSALRKLFDVGNEVLALEVFGPSHGRWVSFRQRRKELERSLQKLLLFPYLYGTETIGATTSTGFPLNWKLPIHSALAFGARVDAELPRLGLEELLDFLLGSFFAVGGAEYLPSVAGFLEGSFADRARGTDEM